MELKNKPHAKGTRQLFNNPVLERLTRTHISIPLILFGTIATGLIVYGLDKGYINAINTPLLFVGGLLSFTLVEYIMHRFVFHLAPKNERQEKFERMLQSSELKAEKLSTILRFNVPWRSLKKRKRPLEKP